MQPSALADRRNIPEATTPNGRLAFKAADTADIAGAMLALDEAEGIVTAVVSVTGTEDEVADVIEPGAYKATLAKRRPKVCWAHKWEEPIGRVLHIEELMPGDPRLPAKARNGQPWPVEAGALVATMQFNLKSARGREAFAAVDFFSQTGECEYSIGYQVPMGKSTKDPRTQVRHIKALELYELSVVLFGAHTETGTLSLKDAYESAMERKTAQGTTGTMDRRAEQPAPRMTAKQALADARKALLTDKPADGDEGVPDFSNGVMVAVYPDGDAASKVASHIAGPDDTLPREDLHVTLAFLGNTDDVGMSSDEIVNAVTGACEGIPVLEGEIGGLGQFPDSGDGAVTWAPVDVPGLSLLREQIVAALGDVVHTDHGFTPHMTLGYDIGLIDPVPSTPVTFSNVRVVYGQTTSDISLGGTGLPDEDRFGKSLTIEDAVRLTAVANLAAQTKAGGADRNAGGAEKLRDYWVHGEGAAKIAWGTPGDFTRCVKLLDEHMPGRAEGYCANRHKEATGMWPGDKNNKSVYDPMLDRPAAYDPDLDGKAQPIAPGGGTFPYLPGTWEVRMSAVRNAVNEALRGEPKDEDGDRYEWDHVTVDGTWDETVIASRVKWNNGDDCRETFEFPYVFTPDGYVDLGDPAPVTLQVIATTDRGEPIEDPVDLPIADSLPLADDLGAIIYALKSTKRPSIEGKAGRVLSGRNERRLREAVQTLLMVLAAAGVEIDPDDPEPNGVRSTTGDVNSDVRREVDPTIDTTSTAPAASGRKVLLSIEDLNADLADLRAGL